MTQESLTHVMIIKVDFEGDVRRISTELPEGESRAQIFHAIRTAVAEGFDFDKPVVGASFPVLKYRDEEGDLCTLVEASVDDMLEFSKGGTLRLFMSTTHAVIVEAIVKEEMPREMPELKSVAETAADTALAVSTEEDSVPADAAAATEEDTVEGTQEEAAAEEVTTVKAAEEQASPQEGAAAEDAVTEEGASTVEAAAEEPGSEQPNELDNTPEGEAEAAEPQHEEEPEMSCGDHARALNEMKTMGFGEDEAQQALEDAHGNLKLAVEYLINPKPHSSTEAPMFEKLDERLGRLPSNMIEQLQMLRGQLQEVLSNVKQHQKQFQDRMGTGEFEHFQRLQATLEQMKARLGEMKELVQAGVKKARGSQPNAQEEEALRKAEARLADAQHFVVETLASLHAHGSEVIKGATAKYSRKLDPKDEDGDAVSTETMDAAVSATVDAVEMAAASVDEFLSADPSTGSTGHSAPAENTCAPKPDVKNATRMDHAQVLLSMSVGGLRSLASGLVRSDCPDPWLTVPSRAAANATAAAATEDDAVAAVAASAAAHNVTIAEAMRVAQSQNA